MKTHISSLSTNSTGPAVKGKRPRGEDSSIERSSLPIDLMCSQLISTTQKHQTTIVVGETGSGKSSRLPQFLYQAMRTQLNAGNGSCIVCTQPRRVAAITIAQRVAQEMQSGPVGQGLVGHTVRFDDASSSSTRIKYVTDGVLLREAMTDADLRKYSVVILDEAHERSLQTDVLMGLLQQLQRRRPSLRILVMSATLDIEMFSSFFQDTAVSRHFAHRSLLLFLYIRDIIWNGCRRLLFQGDSILCKRCICEPQKKTS